MWDRLAQLYGNLQLKPVHLSVEPPTTEKWVWLTPDGDTEEQQGPYPHRRIATLSLSEALDYLKDGRAVQCVGGPRGEINLGDSFYTPIQGKPWYRWHECEWEQNSHISGEELRSRIVRWAGQSRWIVVSPPRWS
jgi:hypothetical protein